MTCLLLCDFHHLAWLTLWPCPAAWLAVCPCPCPAGKSINLAQALPGRGFTSGVLGCPEGRVVCPQLSCKKPCVNGQCYQGRCICDMEFTGEDCSKNLVPGWS